MPDPIIPEYDAGPALARRFAYIDAEDVSAGTITIIEEARFIDRAPDDGMIDDPWPGVDGISDPIIDIRVPLPSAYNVIPAGQEILKKVDGGWLVWTAPADMKLLDSQIEAFPLPNQDYKGLLYRKILKYGQTLPEMEDVLGEALYEAVKLQAETFEFFNEEFDSGAGSSLIALLNQFVDLMGANAGDSIVYEWMSTTHIKVLAGGQCRSNDGQKTYKIEEDIILEIGYNLSMEIYEHLADSLLEVWIYTDSVEGMTIHALYPPVYLDPSTHPAQLREFLLTDGSGDLIPFSAPVLAHVPAGFGCDFYGAIAPLGWACCDGSVADHTKFPVISGMLGGINYQIDTSTVPPDPDDWTYITVPGAPFPSGDWVDVKWVAETPPSNVNVSYTYKVWFSSGNNYEISYGGYPFYPNKDFSGDQYLRLAEVYLPDVADKIIKLG